jgi:hypothetical protein
MKLLIVEGTFDKSFFEALLSALKIKDVEVKTPGCNGKGNAIKLFTTSLKMAKSGDVERLALIIDSDFSDISSQGFRKTLNDVIDKVTVEGFTVKTSAAAYQNGILLEDKAYSAVAALWIMPDNKTDGYIEYLLFEALNAVKPDMATEAADIVEKIRNKEYPHHHEMKANLAVAMAMLDNPGRNISRLISKNILDYRNNPSLKKLTSFLSSFFK